MHLSVFWCLAKLSHNAREISWIILAQEILNAFRRLLDVQWEVCFFFLCWLTGRSEVWIIHAGSSVGHLRQPRMIYVPPPNVAKMIRKINRKKKERRRRESGSSAKLYVNSFWDFFEPPIFGLPKHPESTNRQTSLKNSWAFVLTRKKDSKFAVPNLKQVPIVLMKNWYLGSSGSLLLKLPGGNPNIDLRFPLNYYYQNEWRVLGVVTFI